MNKDYKALNLRLTLRIVAAEIIMFLTVFSLLPRISDIIKRMLDSVYRTTNSQFWYTIYWFVSDYQVIFMIGGFFVLNTICLIWAVRPVFSGLSKVGDALSGLSAEEGDPAVLPAGFHDMGRKIEDARMLYRLRSLEARDAVARKDDLVVSLAHDIRTPLTSVLGYLELLEEGEALTEAQRRSFTEVALRKANRLSRLVEELFEITRFQLSRLVLERQEVNVNILINQLREEMLPVLRERGITCDIENRGLTTVFADPMQLARVFENLLSNAAGYTDEQGHISITLSSNQDGQSVIEVTNTGVEIPPEKLAHVFERFYRADAARRSTTGGSGLGLAIAKQIVEAHSGTICARSADHRTTFIVRL